MPAPSGGPNLGGRVRRVALRPAQCNAGRWHASARPRHPSGCLVLGRHPKALRRLGGLFPGQAPRSGKTYWAVVAGRRRRSRRVAHRRRAAQGNPPQRLAYGRSTPPASHAETGVPRPRRSGNGRTWLELTAPDRPHAPDPGCIAAALGCPVVGDPAYGGPADLPLLLHARAISLPLYPARPPVTATAPVPPHILAALTTLGYDPALEEAPGSAMEAMPA